MIVTPTILVMMKDRPETYLSTDNASFLASYWVKFRLSVFVKAVDRTSSGKFSQLSHFSVDNMV